MLANDRWVETEKSDGAGSDGIGGGEAVDAFLATSCASCWAKYFAYSVNDKLLLLESLFLKCGGVSLCPFNSCEDLDVRPVEVLPVDPDEKVLA
jgi:hypothetical protein